MTQYTGKIIHINSKEGYGFITTPEIPFERIFFHWSALREGIKFLDLTKGMVVTFETKEFEDRGLRAIHVEVVRGVEDA